MALPRCYGWLGALLALMLPAGLNAHADQSAISEYSLKAVLLFKLPQFVYWPDGATPRNPQIFCVLGANPFGKILEKLAREPVDAHTAEIVKLAAIGDNIQCDFLYISRSESAGMETIIRKLVGKRMVSVSDIPGFAKAGGMVELTVSGERVGVMLNRKAAQKQGLEFNAQLLRLAKTVE
ncbi:MAG: YfiR family protein [Sulfuricellaceae bacterium]